MKAINKFFLLASLSIVMISCSEEETDVSTITKFPTFTFDGLQDSYVFDEVDTILNLPFTFNDNQIYAIEVDIEASSNSTATEDLDYSIGSHHLEIPTLSKSGSIELHINADDCKEEDEKIFLVLTSTHPSGNPISKTIEITIRNQGGCPEYKQEDFVGTFIVESDEWQDWAPGTEIEVEAGPNPNILSFKYNCGSDAKPIFLNILTGDCNLAGSKAEYCSYTLPPVTKFFGDVVEGTGSIFNTCNKELFVDIAHSDANGANYGSYQIVLKKK